MLYQLQQQKIPYNDKSVPSRTVYIDLPDKVHALAEQLGIGIVMEVGPELISLEGTVGNKTYTKVAALEIPGFTLGTTKLPGPQRACIEMIQEAWQNSQQK